jgi:hypothetical protein
MKTLLFNWKAGVAAVVALACWTCLGQSAKADFQSQLFDLNVSNSFSGTSTTYATVLVEAWDGTGTGGGGLLAGQVRLTLTDLPTSQEGTPGPNFGSDNFGFNSAAGFTGVTFSAPTGWSALNTTGTQMDGFGNFAGFTKNNPTGGPGPIAFLLSGFGANATLANFEVGSTGASNAGGPFFFATHILDFANNPTSQFVGGSTPGGGGGNLTPEPASVVMMGFGALALLGVARRSRNKVAA